MRPNEGLAREYESSLTNTAHNFGLKVSPQAFKILSSSLYSDPILAVVRELFANAWDSHQKSDNTSYLHDITIHTPTTLEPHFSVTDYGVSMSHKFVMERYVTFFDSDKDHNNDAIGGFGLGSKAPFAYTDQFTLVTRLQNIERRYHLFIDETSNYKILLVSEKPTTQPDGVKVECPVAPKDFDAFEEAIAKTLKYFDRGQYTSNSVIPEPNLTPPVILPHSQVEVAYEETSQYRGYYDTAKMTVVMGGLPYKLTVDQQNQADLFEMLDSTMMHAPIGMFDITPDRESIRMSPKSMQVLTRIKNEYTSVFAAQITRTLSRYNTALEKYKYIMAIPQKVRRKLSETTLEVEAAENNLLTELQAVLTPKDNTHVAVYRIRQPYRGDSGWVVGTQGETARELIHGWLLKSIDEKPATVVIQPQKGPYKTELNALIDNGTIKVGGSYLIRDVDNRFRTWCAKNTVSTVANAGVHILTMAKPPRQPRAKSTSTVKSLGTFKYWGHIINGETGIVRTRTMNAQEIQNLSKSVSVGITHQLVESVESVYQNMRPYMNKSKKALYLVAIPGAHNKVREALVAESNIGRLGKADEVSNGYTTINTIAEFFIEQYGIDKKMICSYLVAKEFYKPLSDLMAEYCVWSPHYSHQNGLMNTNKVFRFTKSAQLKAAHPQLHNLHAHAVNLYNTWIQPHRTLLVRENLFTLTSSVLNTAVNNTDDSPYLFTPGYTRAKTKMLKDLKAFKLRQAKAEKKYGSLARNFRHFNDLADSIDENDQITNPAVRHFLKL